MNYKIKKNNLSRILRQQANKVNAEIQSIHKELHVRTTEIQ